MKLKDFFLVEDSVNQVVYDEVKKNGVKKLKSFVTKKKKGRLDQLSILIKR